jgi:TRAP-type C4-dicarboxylate transport system permease small subunit
MRQPIKFARVIHLISALWTLGLALLIFSDVMGRSFFSSPVPGTKEVIQNSVVAITFLQLPLAIYSGSMLRTSIFADSISPFGKKLLRTLCFILGILFLLGLAKSSWTSFFEAYRIGEYEGEGALRVPTWPVRGLIFCMALFGAFAYFSMIIFDWTNRLSNKSEAPEAVR